MHELQELSKVRYVVEHYEHLQGLRLIPLSLLFFLSALSRAWFTSASVDSIALGRWFVLLFVAALAASYACRAYYHERFGRTRSLPARSGAATLCGCFIAFLALLWVQSEHEWPIAAPILIVAVLLARLGLVEHRLRRHYLWVAGARVAFAVLGPLGVSLHLRDVGFDLLIGGGLVVAGLGDHHVLRTILHEVGGDGYAPAI